MTGQAISEQWDREEEERAERGEVRTCPVCGGLVLFTCFHDDVDVRCEDMPSAAAVRLAEAWSDEDGGANADALREHLQGRLT